MPGSDFTPYFFLVLGIVCLLSAIFKKPKPKTFFDNAEMAEGIIFDLDYSNNPSSAGEFAVVKNKVTVRFLTKKQEWITAEIAADNAVFYTGQYQEGDLIKLLYDPVNPRDFVVLTKQSPELALVLFIVVGFIFLGTGAYMILMP